MCDTIAKTSLVVGFNHCPFPEVDPYRRPVDRLVKRLEDSHVIFVFKAQKYFVF